MINARHGDTLLHIALRVNGAEPEQKATVVTELLGQGCSHEVTNNELELPANVDQAIFHHAFLHKLPEWNRVAAAKLVQVSAEEAKLRELEMARIRKKMEIRERVQLEERAQGVRHAAQEARRQARSRRAHNALVAVGLHRLIAREARANAEQGVGSLAPDLLHSVLSVLPQPVQQVLPVWCYNLDSDVADDAVDA